MGKSIAGLLPRTLHAERRYTVPGILLGIMKEAFMLHLAINLYSDRVSRRRYTKIGNLTIRHQSRPGIRLGHHLFLVKVFRLIPIASYTLFRHLPVLEIYQKAVETLNILFRFHLKQYILHVPYTLRYWDL